MSARLDPAVIREIVAEVRGRFPVSRVAGPVLKLVRCGGEWKACCPFHDDSSPSFTIFDGDTRWHCFGCLKNGDVIDFVVERFGLRWRDAIESLDAGALPIAAPLADTPKQNSAIGDYSDAARRIWQQAVEVREETAAYHYLASRALGGPVPVALRYAKLRCKIYDGDNGPRRPALVALVVDVDGNPVGVQRTYLNEDGTKAFGRDSKLSLGRVKGGAIRLAPALGEVCLTEGMEDALSLQRMSGIPAWAGAGADMLKAMRLPADVRTVTIGGDADEPGRLSAQGAMKAYVAQGRSARIIYPAAPHKDFNAELMAEVGL